MFSLDKEESQKLSAWLDAKYAQLVEKQRGTHAEQCHVTDKNGRTRPYLGAIGGGLTYSFTPTSLGTIVEVTWCAGTPDEDTVNLTNYDLW